jgi:phenylalanyl-tRNA synthetase beta chain
MGLWHEHSWQGEKKPVDFYVIKGVVEGLLEELHVSGEVRFEQTEKAGLHPGRTATLVINDIEVGCLGQLHPAVAKAWSLPATYVFELNLQHLLSLPANVVRYEAIPRYPAIQRDIALVVDEAVQAEKLKRVIMASGGRLLRHAEVFDVYQGEHLEEGKKSLAFSLKYQDPEKTLTDDEVTAVHTKVLQALEEKTGATLRS